jgi:hypothetical protein
MHTEPLARLLTLLVFAATTLGCARGGGSGFGDSTGATSGGTGSGSAGVTSGGSNGDAPAGDQGGSSAPPGVDAGASESGAVPQPTSCPASSVMVSVVDYFTGAPVSLAMATVDGAPAGSGASLCFTLATGVHPVSISASGYATYNGAVQLPGGAMTRTVPLFPVGPSLAGWLALVNADRQANGAPPVQLDDWLTIVAWDHAVDMAVQGYYAHFDPHGLAPTTRSLLLGSMVMGSENLDVGSASYADAETAFMVEKSQLPNQSPSDCANDDSLAGHYCNIVAAPHNWVGLAVADVPQSQYGTYYDEEFGDLYGYYDTTVIPAQPALGTTASLSVVPAPGQTFQYGAVEALSTPVPIPIATLNADPTCASMCPSTDQWYPTTTTQAVETLAPFSPDLSQNQIVFAAIYTNEPAFVGAAAYAAFWAGGNVTLETYGAASVSYLVP